MQITSKDNQYIRLINELKKKKFRDKYGLFLAEGKRLISDFLSASFLPHVVLYAESFQDYAFLEECCRASDKIFSVPDQLFHKLTETEHDQGILAAFPMLSPKPDSYSPEKSGLILILNDVRDPGNLGTIVRSAAAADVSAILMEEGCVDLYNPKVIRSTMGTITKIPVFAGLRHEEIMGFIKKNDINVYLADMRQSVSYEELPFDRKIAVVFGNEGEGISEVWRKESFPGVMIPMKNGVESLNVAMAAGIISFDYNRKIRNGLK